METLTIEKIKELAKCSTSTAIELRGSALFQQGKLYLNRGNNAASTINFLVSKHNVVFGEIKNNAPRGGKIGSYREIITSSESFLKLKSDLCECDRRLTNEAEEKAKQRQIIVDCMTISDEEKNKFIEKTKGLSNRAARKIAYNFSAKKIGFYDVEAMKKFYSLI